MVVPVSVQGNIKCSTVWLKRVRQLTNRSLKIIGGMWEKLQKYTFENDIVMIWVLETQRILGERRFCGIQRIRLHLSNERYVDASTVNLYRLKPDAVTMPRTKTERKNKTHFLNKTGNDFSLSPEISPGNVNHSSDNFVTSPVRVETCVVPVDLYLSVTRLVLPVTTF